MILLRKVPSSVRQPFSMYTTLTSNIHLYPINYASNSPEKIEDDAPIEMQNPYEKEKRKCLLCRTGIQLDYKNARLLQQFVSTFSGRIYDRHITRLCDHQQKKLVETIALSRKAGYMPIFVKDPKYTRDPKLFDPLKPIRPHSFA